MLAAVPFLERGYEVIDHRDVLDPGARDDLVVKTAILNQAILIAVDADMKQLVRRFGSPNNSEKFAKLDLISISCHETLAAKRLEQACH